MKSLQLSLTSANRCRGLALVTLTVELADYRLSAVPSTNCAIVLFCCVAWRFCVEFAVCWRFNFFCFSSAICYLSGLRRMPIARDDSVPSWFSLSGLWLRWVIWPVKIVPEMTYKVSSGTLNLCSLTCGCAVQECLNGLRSCSAWRPQGSYWLIALSQKALGFNMAASINSHTP